MIDTDKYEEFENAMNEGRIERVHCLWALAEVKHLRGRLSIVEDFIHGLRPYVGGNAFDHIMFDMRKALGDEEE